MHTVALAEGNKVYSWGVNDEGALGRNTGGEIWKEYNEINGTTGNTAD